MLVRPSVLVLLSLLAAAGLPLPVAAQARAQLGPEGTAELTIGWRLIETARFHRQGFAVDGPFERKNTLSWSATYVVAPDLALHAGGAWARMFAAAGGSPTGGPEVHQGRQDTVLGLTWRVRDPDPGAGPTLAVRVGGTIPGPYDAGYTNSLGDGVTDLAVAAIAEDFTGRVGWTGEVGYRHRSSSIVNPAGIGRPTPHYDRVDVPSELFVAGGVYAALHPRFGLGAEYAAVNGRSGLDIGLPGWRPDRWPALHEDIHLVGLRADVGIGPRRALTLRAGRVIAGRNTPAYAAYSAAFTFGLAAPAPH